MFVRSPRWLLRSVARRFPGALFLVETKQKAVALTIDDGPDPETTPRILDVLARHGAHATFFLLGSRAQDRPGLLEAIRAGGHEVGNHLYTDRMALRLTSSEFVDELQRTDAVLRPAGPVKWCRPGSGGISTRLVRLLDENGYRPCLATVYPMDAHLPPAVAERQFLTNLRPGSVLVVHDGPRRGRRAIRILEQVLPRAQARGYRVLTVSQLVESAQ